MNIENNQTIIRRAENTLNTLKDVKLRIEMLETKAAEEASRTIKGTEMHNLLCKIVRQSRENTIDVNKQIEYCEQVLELENLFKIAWRKGEKR